MAQQQKATFSGLPRVVNGSIAGLVGVCCVFPIDLVKTRLQNQEIGPNGERMYKGMFDCAKKTWAKENGFFSLYRGSGVNLLLITPEKVIKLVGNDFFRHHLKDRDGNLSFARGSLAGAMAGGCQIIITTPMELLKIQQQDQGRTTSKLGADGKAVQHITATQSALNLIREKGITGVYRGYGATALRDVPFSALYFPLYALFRKTGANLQGGGKASPGVDFMSGILAGATAAFAVTPMDVVKTRLQTIVKAADEKVYKGVVDCFVQIYRTEGITALYKGGACRIAVIAPLFGIAQMFYMLGIAEYLLGYPRPQY